MKNRLRMKCFGYKCREKDLVWHVRFKGFTWLWPFRREVSLFFSIAPKFWRLEHFGLLLFLISFLPACKEAPDKIEIFSKDDKLLERFYLTKDEHLRQGPYVLYDSTGTVLLEEAWYEKGKYDGVRKLYYPTGELQIEEHYANGLFQGPYRTYYKNGQVELEGEYVNNEMTGPWKRYYPSGQLMEVVEFKHNQENGPFVEYYENGALKAKGSYQEGDKEHGLLLLYDSTGTLVRKMNCVRGLCKTFWTPDSTAVE